MIYLLPHPLYPPLLKRRGGGEFLKRLCSTVFTKMSKLHTLGLRALKRRGARWLKNYVGMKVSSR